MTSNNTDEKALQNSDVTFEPNEIIFSEWEHGTDCYLITGGRVSITRIINNQLKILDELGAGSILGEMALLESSPRTATVTAITEVKAFRVTQKSFQPLIKIRPEIGITLVERGARRLYNARKRVEMLRVPQLSKRVTLGLILLAERGGATEKKDQEVILSATPETIAQWCSFPYREVKACLDLMKQRGNIAINPKDGTVKLLNFPALLRQSRLGRQQNIASAGVSQKRKPPTKTT